MDDDGFWDKVADLPPGPELGALLARVDRASLVSTERALVAEAWARQAAHAQAQLLASAWDVGLTCWKSVGSTQRLTEPNEFSADEVAVTLTLSQIAARGLLTQAERLIVKLPAVYAELLAGRIDWARAQVFADLLGDASPEVADAVLKQTLEDAATSTAAEVRQRVRYRLHRADPTTIKRRLARSIVERYVHIGLDADGCGYLSATGLPADRAAEADDWLDRLARRAKSMGDQRTLAQLRTDAMLDLLTGVAFRTLPTTGPAPLTPGPAPLTPWATDVIANHLQEFGEPARPTPPTQPTAAPANAAADAGEGEPGAGVARADRGRLDDSQLLPRCPIARDSADYHAENTIGEREMIGYSPITAHAAAGLLAFHTHRLDGDTATGPPPPMGEVVTPGQRRGVVEITVSLTTLIGLNDNPAWIPGWGPVIADIARQVAHDQDANPLWAFNIHDDAGRLLFRKTTRRRPTTTDAEFVRARDRRCRFMWRISLGCQHKARRTDLDHRHDHAKGGASEPGNLDCLCRRHHRLKHERGFRVHVNNHGAYFWRAPDDRLYLVKADGTAYLTGDDLDNAPPPRPTTTFTPRRRKSPAGYAPTQASRPRVRS